MSRKQQMSKLKSLIYVCGSATGVFSIMCYYQENEKFYENVLLPVLHRLNPETSHHLAIAATKYNLVPKSPYKDPASLKSAVWGMELQNPVGLAAGFDKGGEGVQCLHGTGFGFVEVGSVTPEPQPGNDKPRLFRLPRHSAIINRYGFNSEGHTKVAERVKALRRRKDFHGVVGINLGKNKDSADPIEDYVRGIKLLGPLADYLVVNISSPNTAGLRDWQQKEHLEEMLRHLVATRDSLSSRPPLLVKLSPDLSLEQCREIASVLLLPQCRVDGVVVANTSTELGRGLEGPSAGEAGGISGRPLTQASTRMIRNLYTLTQGRIAIIGVGGVFSGQDAYDKIKAGASLVQVYTAYIYHGPPRITAIKRQLAHLLQADGHSCVAEAIGKDVKLGEDDALQTEAETELPHQG